MKTVATALLLASLWSFAPALRAETLAHAVADATSGHILDSANGEKKLPIASLTKIATAMVVLDWSESKKRDLSQQATVPRGITSVGGANPIGFLVGERVSLRDLLYATLLQSDNVAAYILADHVGHTLMTRTHADADPVDLFVAQMNALARKLDMKRTRFLNPHGLDNQERPYSTAHDLVKLTRYAMERSSFRFYVSQKQRRITRTLPDGEPIGYNLINTNELLGVDSIDGVKTGRTAAAGPCLVLSAARTPDSRLNADGTHTITPRRLIVVSLNSTNRFGESAHLLRRGWNQYDAWAAKGRPLGKSKE